MTLLGKEHYELIEQFDREYKHLRLDKEPKNLWAIGHVYQDGNVNELFVAYRRGVAYGRAVYA